MYLCVHWGIKGEHQEIYTTFKHVYFQRSGLPRWPGGKEPACQCRRHKRCRFDPCVGKIPWSRKWQPTLVFLPWISHGQRNPEGYSPWGRKRVGHNLVTKQKQTSKERLGTPGLSFSVTKWRNIATPGKITQEIWMTWAEKLCKSLIYEHIYMNYRDTLNT